MKIIKFQPAGFFSIFKHGLPAVVFTLTLTLALSLTWGIPHVVASDKNCQDNLNCRSSWVTANRKELKRIYGFAEDYKAFIARARTELSFVAEALKFAEKNGFKPLRENSAMTPGQRYYDVNRDRSISFMVIGRESLDRGIFVVGAHIDSPRLELKGRPLYGSGEFALFQTNFHGGIKNYQWTNIPLALMGRVDKKDGTRVNINIGLAPNDPIFMISDLSPHTDRGYGDKKVKEMIRKEDLDPVAGHIPARDGAVESRVMDHLKRTYDISAADLVSAEIALVPAYAPRDLGFDRGLIAAYGQDDRLASFAAMRAIANLKIPRKTAMAHLVDNEEVGNRNNTGAKSEYFSTLIARMLQAKLGGDYREMALKKTLRNSKMLSVDVNPGINPRKPSAWEGGNAPRLGYGVNIKLYGRGNTANSEYIAWTRKYLDDAKIPWQTTTYKVGVAGGGTIGGEFSRQNMDVIDIGVPLLSIHSPYSISSKIDLFHLYRASQVFFEN